MQFSYARKGVDAWQQCYKRKQFSGAASYSALIMKRFVRVSRVDANGEEPHQATRLSVGELLHQIAVPDAKSGHYRFDEEAIAHLEEYLGVFLGYMSGPSPVSMYI